MYKTANTLPEQIRSRSVALLNRHLAAAIDLHAQVKQAHWNVRGPTFIAIHELFDKIADVVEEYSDKIAERAGTLGGTAEGTVQIAAERSFLEAYRLGVADEKAHIAAVTAALVSFGESAATRSRRVTSSATSTPPTCSPRSRAASITSSG
jgi:starvation-inducible DNA-binding protein